MKTTFVLLILLSIVFHCSSQVILNEVQTSNNSTIKDNYGQYEDWIEIFNPNDFSVDVAGLVLKDNVDTWQIPSGDTTTLLDPGEYFLLWADDEEEQGKSHTNFKLSASNGEFLGLYEPDGTTLIDSLQIPPLSSDVSYGRCFSNWLILDVPSPMTSNTCAGSSINNIASDLIKTTVIQGKLYINISKHVSNKKDLFLYSLNGSLLSAHTLHSNVFMHDLSHYDASVFILQIKTPEFCWTEKIILLN